MSCPGSVALSYGVEDEDNEYSLPGQQAHALAEYCLYTERDAWELVRDDLVVHKEMADAVQVYLNDVRGYELASDDKVWTEFTFHCPTLHEYYWGQADRVLLRRKARELHPWDYKHGVGIVVEVEENPQLMYYACGVLESLGLWNDVDRVILHVAQPRGFHYDGPLREWAIGTQDLSNWLHNVLLPAMDRALASRETASGEHCRFCPARRLACPQIIKDFDELEEIIVELSKKDSAAELSGEQVGRFLDLLDVAKIAGKAASATAFNRMTAGHQIPGRKLVKARSNRDWKPEAEPALKKQLGKDAYTLPELKSPAQIDALPRGKQLTTRWAFKPDKGLTIASEGENRLAVEAGSIKKMFKDKPKKEK